MNQQPITVVRLYCSEHDNQHRRIIDLLHKDHSVAGVTAFRGIAGFGGSGRLHEAALLDMSLDLPIVVEFFDVPEKVAAVLPRLQELLGPGHIVTWPAEANFE